MQELWKLKALPGWLQGLLQTKARVADEWPQDASHRESQLLPLRTALLLLY